MKSHVLILTILLAASAPLFGEEVSQETDAKPGEPVVHNKTLWEQVKEGGWVMVPIGLCSVLTLYLVGDGFLRVTNPKKLLPPAEIEAVKEYYRQGKYSDAYFFCKSSSSAFANVTRVATSQLGEGKSATEEAVIAEMMKENSRMQTFISYLSVIGVCTPMIGLVGTVTGMMGAFATLGTSGIGDPSQLSAHIGEVLVATASGLFVAIPAFTAYYWLRNRAAKTIHDIQDTTAQLMRRMPYDKLKGAHIGDEEIVAADPEWWIESDAALVEA
ncbi:MAG: MotA/TolQ/ExbB proton channel family protein [Roseimicrobium sp.]